LPCARTRRMAKTFHLPCAVEKRTTNKTHGKVFITKLIFVLLLISPLQKHYSVLYISNLHMSRLIYYF
jgi:hypothetical protein